MRADVMEGPNLYYVHDCIGAVAGHDIASGDTLITARQ